MILYEYPCNERIRIFLRVESSFNRLFYFTNGTEPQLHQVAISVLFELLELTERSDFRGMVLQDLERQRVALSALREHPQVSGAMLDQTLDEIKQVSSTLAAQGRIAQDLRDHEWLNSLRGRMAIAGGCSAVDVPSFYGWQMKDVEQRRADINRWCAPFMPLYQALSLILRILRGAGSAVVKQATEGSYQEMLGGKSFQLLRVWVDPQYAVFPEMSANKYVILVRFARQDPEQKTVTIKQDIPFQLSRCNIG